MRFCSMPLLTLLFRQKERGQWPRLKAKAVWKEKHMGGMAAQPAAHNEKPCVCFGDCAGSLGDAWRARCKASNTSSSQRALRSLSLI